jgi:hypothetical protein
MCETVINEFTKEKTCKNESNCKQHSLSWSLPYEYYPEENLLVVVNNTFRYFWDKEVLTMNQMKWNCKVCPIDGMVAGSYVIAHLNIILSRGSVSIHKQMKIEMEEAGWMEAVSIKKEEEPKVIKALNIFEGGILENNMQIIYPDLMS